MDRSHPPLFTQDWLSSCPGEISFLLQCHWKDTGGLPADADKSSPVRAGTPVCWMGHVLRSLSDPGLQFMLLLLTPLTYLSEPTATWGLCQGEMRRASGGPATEQTFRRCLPALTGGVLGMSFLCFIPPSPGALALACIQALVLWEEREKESEAT